MSTFKVADSIAVDESGYAKGILKSVEFTQFIDSNTGEIKEQLEFIWETTTRKGLTTSIHFWSGLNINPRLINGKYTALTHLLLIHKLITTDDLKKLAADEKYLDELDIDLEKMVGVSHKFKLVDGKKGLSKPDVSTLQIIKSLELTSAKV